jgi:hypothetical protein
MTFWIGIIIGGIFAWNLVRTGFCESWLIFFNIVLAIYLAIYLQPAIAQSYPSTAQSSFNITITMLITASAGFLALYGLFYMFFTSQFSATFPKVLEIIGSGILGFLTGFLFWSFVCLLICMTELSQSTLVRGIDFEGNTKKCNVPYLCFWCELINTAVSPADEKIPCRQAVEKLLEKAQRKRQTTRPSENIPPGNLQHNEPNTTPLDIPPDITTEPNQYKKANEPNRPLLTLNEPAACNIFYLPAGTCTDNLLCNNVRHREFELWSRICKFCIQLLL